MDEAPKIGRNEPCPCGSGKKYKRCCGKNAAPKLSEAKTDETATAAGFDPSQFDQDQINQMSQMMKKLPKGQIQKLQSLVQKAMAGQDVTRDLEGMQKALPVELQEMINKTADSQENTANKQTGQTGGFAKFFGKFKRK